MQQKCNIGKRIITLDQQIQEGGSICDSETSNLFTLHRLKPPQNPNKSAKKMFFFHGNFDMVGTRIEKSLI